MPISIFGAGSSGSTGIDSVEGVSNPGGNIDLVPADSIVITGNDALNEITIGESHSGLTNNPHSTKQIKQNNVSSDTKVPVAGTLYLSVGNVPTSASPFIMNVAGKIRGGWIAVDAADASRVYALEIIKGITVVETLTLPLSTTEVSTVAFTTTVAVNDKIQVRLRRTSGAGKSTFSSINAAFDLLEDPQ